MKHLKKISILIILILVLTGCNTKQNNMKNINIYTTTYPINFLIDNLYKENCKIYSIYPTGIDLTDYELSKRKLEEYAKKSDLFIFNSLDKDRDYAVEMININPKLKVIDVATGMSYDNSITELWINPNNYLMMAENIKNGLAEYIDNPYLVEEVENNFNDLQYEISKLDANLTEVIADSNYKTIITDDNTLKVLENRGLKVISLKEDKDLTSNKIDEVKRLIEDKQIKYVYTTSKEPNKTIKNLIDTYKIENIQLNNMHSIDGGITNSNDNYLTIMTNNINNLKKELYK